MFLCVKFLIADEKKNDERLLRGFYTGGNDFGDCGVKDYFTSL